MLQKAKVWIRAARLRTLPLSIAGIISGNALSLSNPHFSWSLFGLMMITAMLFQVVSNFANDYGDGVKGTDNAQRIGPERVFQAGLLSRASLKKGIQITAGLAFLMATILIFLAFGGTSWHYIFLFLGLSVASIWAAVKYTVGNNAYGYYGWGDVFVFLFFGGLSVLGASFLQQNSISIDAYLLVLVIGALSVAVLNLNNMRDIESDSAVGKRTVAVKLGVGKAKRYHIVLILGALSGLFLFLFKTQPHYFWLPLLICIPLGLHLKRVIQNTRPVDFDPELKIVALSTFALSVLLFIALYLSS